MYEMKNNNNNKKNYWHQQTLQQQQQLLLIWILLRMCTLVRYHELDTHDFMSMLLECADLNGKFD